MDGRACGVDAVFDTMLGVQGGKVRPCGFRAVGEELVVLVSCLGNGAEVKRRGPCFMKWKGKICFAIHESFSPEVHSE